MKLRLLVSLICLLFLPEVSSAAPPKSLAGVALGASVDDISDKIDMSTSLPLWGAPYLSKVSLKPVEGFRSGYVVYGTCKNIGRIIRIKMSYEDEGEELYHRLHIALAKRYGKAAEWRGNPFGTLRVWKWSMKDPSHNSISIIIERYEGEDDSFTPGNSIRLTNSTLMEEEKACYEAKPKELQGGKNAGTSAATHGELDLDRYLPQ
jgi:hypothetical protein